MSKQDRQGVRSPTDHERKYDHAAIEIVKMAVENHEEGINKTNKILEDFVKQTLGSFEEMQSQIDGNIETHFYSGVPTLENEPASGWSTDEEKQKHLRDLYYDKDTGRAYRFVFDNETYGWIEIEDNDMAQVLAIANAAKDTADSKRRIFVAKPEPPYDNGDLWFYNNEIYICQISKPEGESYSEEDFIIATKYTDDTYAKKVGDELEVVRGSVTIIKANVDKVSSEVKTLVDDVEVAKSSIEQNATEIMAKVSKGEVSSELSLELGKIVLKGNRLVIESDNLKVDAEGNVTITGDLVGSTFYAEATSIKTAADYTEADKEIARRITNGIKEITFEDIEKYDMDGDGDISAIDYVKLVNLLEGRTEKVEISSYIMIDPNNPNSILRTNNVFIGGGGIYGKKITAKEITSRSYSTTDSEGNNYNGIFNSKIPVAGAKYIEVHNGLVTGTGVQDYKILWSGGLYMQANQSIYLSGSISQMPSGIILVFSPYNASSGAVHNYDFNSFFISSHTVAEHSGMGHSFFMTASDLSSIGNKYLYLSDNQIKGYTYNNQAYTKNGITVDNTKWVLRYVLGF